MTEGEISSDQMDRKSSSRQTLGMHLIFVSSIHMRVTQLIGKESPMENQN
jgi:hypothetical protein